MSSSSGRNSGRWWLLALTLVGVNVAGIVWIHHDLTHRQGRIRVLDALPRQNVDQTDRFTLVFDETVVPLERVGAPPERELFEIDPPLPGRWIWNSGERLDYLLDKPLPPGRSFTVRPVADFETRVGQRLVGTSEFDFKTRALRLIAVEPGACDEQTVRFSLVFNQPVAPQQLSRAISLRPSGEDRVSIPTVVTSSPSERMTLTCDRPANNAATLRIDGRLVGDGGNLPLGKEVVRPIGFDPAFVVLRAYAESPGMEPGSTLHLSFSRRLRTDQEPPQVRIEPPVTSAATRVRWDSIIVEASFEPGRHYRVTVPQTVIGHDGSTLGSDQSLEFEVPDRDAAIAFRAGSGILSPAGQMEIELQAVNVGGLIVEAQRLHPNNLVAHVRGEGPRETSRDLGQRQFEWNAPRNSIETVAVDLAAMVGRTPGVYRVAASASNQTWNDDTSIVCVTDLALTAKLHRDGAMVWVTSLQNGRPVPNARVTAYSYNNQVVASGICDADGVARLSVAENDPDGGIWLIAAELGDDLTYLRPDEHNWVVDGCDTRGRAAPNYFDVMLYGERGIYRPGDTIHLTGIVRDVIGRTPQTLPLQVRLYRPDHKMVADVAVTATADLQGMFHVELPTRADGQTGPYQIVAMLPGSDEVLGRCSLLVEAFQPPRIEVSAITSQPLYTDIEKPSVDVVANYLFGQPCAGLPCSVTASYRVVAFESPRFAGFTFLSKSASGMIKVDDVATVLSDDGTAGVPLPVPDSTCGSGRLQAEIGVTVSELGGRSVSARTLTLLDRIGRHIGVRLADSNVRVAAENTLEWVLVDALGEPLPADTLRLQLSRIETEWVLERVNGRAIWRDVEREIEVLRRVIDAADAPSGDLAFVCPTEGRYRLTLVHDNSGASTGVELYASGDGRTVPSNRPGTLELTADQQRYNSGEQAVINVKSPFAGTMWLTVESDEVLDQRIVAVEAGANEVTIPIDDRMRGGAFVTAGVVRAMNPQDSKWQVHRAMGRLRLAVDHPDRATKLELDVAETIQPLESLRVTVQCDTGGDWPSVMSGAVRPPRVHVWAVDEGILQATALPTPNPFEFYFAPRALAVATSDVYGDLLPDMKRAVDMRRIGAGDDSDKDSDGLSVSSDGRDLRRSQVPIDAIEPVVLWSESIVPNADGRAELTLHVPEYTGRLRIMAVCVDGDRYASAEKAVTVTSPLLVEASTPRFLAPDDRAEISVRLFNNSDQPVEAALGCEISGPVSLQWANATSDGMKLVALAPRASQLVNATVTATGIGNATLLFQADSHGVSGATGESVHAQQTSKLTVRPASTLATTTEFLEIAAGRELTIVPRDMELYLPDGLETTVTLSGSPSVELRAAFDQLLDYPHGCAEQTTSQLLAMLHAPQVLSADSAATARGEAVKDLIAIGIDRLASMQTRDGGIAYWPAERTATPWASAYVGEFLMHARQAGYHVPKEMMNGLCDYLTRMLNNGDDELDDNLRAQICLVLATAGRPHEGWMSTLTDRAARLDVSGRAWLTAAWHASGKIERALSVLPSDGDIAAMHVGGSTSNVRGQAVLLRSLVTIDRRHPAIPVLVEHLRDSIDHGWWGTTLGSATALEALCAYDATRDSDVVCEGALTVEGADPLLLSGAPVTRRLLGEVPEMTLRSSGTGSIYAAVTTRGLMKSRHVAEEDHGLVIRRRWLDRQNREIDASHCRTGDLIVVEVTLTAPNLANGEVIDHVAVVDALPGGVEVENPRLATSVTIDMPGNVSTPRRVEFLDDRVVLFTSATREPKRFYYTLRATTPGHFVLPPIEASGMYDAAATSVHGGGVMRVTAN